jgi:hypothetical protein
MSAQLPTWKTDDEANQQHGSGMLGYLDRLTQSAALTISRRSLFKGALAGGVATVTGVGLFQPLQVGACVGCHYCTSGCCTCPICNFICTSYGGARVTNNACCQFEACSYAGTYACDGGGPPCTWKTCSSCASC